MQAVMAYLHLDEIRIHSAGVCEGVLLASARSGARWLDDPALTLDEQQIGKAPLLVQEGRQAAEPQEIFAQSAREELPKRARTFLNWRGAVLLNEDSEAVHKMRVASRRLRAAMDAYQPACQPKSFKQAYRTVKNAADLLGAARDTDVMLQHMERLLDVAPGEEQTGLRWLLEQLKSYRQECQRELEAFLTPLDEHALQEMITSCLPKAASSKGKAGVLTERDPQAPTAQHARRIAHLKLDELYRWNDAVDQPYAVSELHRLRIAAKRLRYTLEVFDTFLPEGCKSVIKELEQVQEELGQLHDRDVLIALLRLCLGSLEYPLESLAFAAGETTGTKPQPFLPTALVQPLLNPAGAVSTEQRYGLEQMVRQQEHLREDVYHAFRQHWYHLQEQDMRRHLLTLLEQGRAAS